MTDPIIASPPSRTPMVDQRGYVTLPWLKWMQKLPTAISDAGFISVEYSGLPQNLGSSSTGLMAYVTDYAHLLLWDGAKWTWGPGDIGSGFVVSFMAGHAPGTGWQVCDGSTVSRLNSDGTLTTVTVPSTGQGGAYGQMVDYYRQ